MDGLRPERWRCRHVARGRRPGASGETRPKRSDCKNGCAPTEPVAPHRHGLRTCRSASVSVALSTAAAIARRGRPRSRDRGSISRARGAAKASRRPSHRLRSPLASAAGAGRPPAGRANPGRVRMPPPLPASSLHRVFRYAPRRPLPCRSEEFRTRSPAGSLTPAKARGLSGLHERRIALLRVLAQGCPSASFVSWVS